MNAQQTVEQLQNTSILYRIQVIEMLLQSLKEKIAENESSFEKEKTFSVRTFDLGTSALPDQEQIYLARGL
ncbi:MAG: hypothetical protein R2873_00810 [Caldilineaceae bacterium]